MPAAKQEKYFSILDTSEELLQVLYAALLSK